MKDFENLILDWSGLRDEWLFQRVESPIASSAHFIELNQLDFLLGKDFDSVDAFFTRKASFRWETLCQNLMVRMMSPALMNPEIGRNRSVCLFVCLFVSFQFVLSGLVRISSY